MYQSPAHHESYGDIHWDIDVNIENLYIYLTNHFRWSLEEMNSLIYPAIHSYMEFYHGNQAKQTKYRVY